MLTRLVAINLLPALLLSTQVHAESFANHQTSRVGYTSTTFDAQLRCKDLVAASNFDFSVISASVISQGDIPSHCRVSGLVPGEVRFEVNLPLSYNGRLYMYGNGGLAGTPAIDPGKQYLRNRALQRGFATAYTDTGHDKRVHPGGTFAYKDFERLVDYGFRAVHLTVMAAKSLINTFYAAPVKHSYWDGCSTGGRQGMLAAQRFPNDFDGIVAGAPAANYSGLKFSQAWRVAAISASGLEEPEVLALAEHIYAACDPLDGLSDGIISDPRRCNFDVDRDLPVCEEADTTSCFDATERAALKHYYAPVELAGQEIYPAMPVGSEVLGRTYSGEQRSGWYPWLINSDGPVLLDLLGSDFFRYMVFVRDQPDFDWTTFDFAGAAPDNLVEFQDIVDAVDPDLSAFRDSGGKLLSYFGWADPDINPLTLIDYRSQVAAMDADVDDYFRVFMIPGMFHCRGGAGPDRFDAMTPLIDWVEQGQAPNQLETWTAAHNGGRGTVRPSCAYPAEALPNKRKELVCTVPTR